MKKDIVLENEYVEVSYISEFELAHLVWKQNNIPSQNYRGAYLELLEYTKEVNGSIFLSDGRLQGVISPEDRKWFLNYAVKRAIANGLKRAVVITKKDPFKKYYMNTIMKFILRKTDLEMKVFYDYDQGLKWLKSYLNK